ncbi:uncharacterized protein LOC135112747 [Scylla paramamosain]|uniref:uncharacterized protein LOC135112747 n=1 Tax=Scylla paramamosain TaxID=85552 RepID=UPI00308281AF
MGMSAVVKLKTLVSAYTGQIRRKVRACMKIENPNTEYKRAFELLEERYGEEDAFVDQMTRGILQGPTVRSGDVKGLRKFADELKECFYSLTILKQIKEIASRYVMYLLANRLPRKIREDYIIQRLNYKRTHKERPGIHRMLQFVRDSTTRAENINEHVPVSVTKDRERASGILHSSQSQQRKRTLGLTTNSLAPSEQGRWCMACLQEAHTLRECQQFLVMNTKQRISFVKGKRLCFSCLSPNHRAYECNTLKRCGINGCGGNHSWLLHCDAGIMGRRQDSQTKGTVRQSEPFRAENKCPSSAT